jgi:hypothetical protein
MPGSNRLRNIEETERAKREMMEERKAASEAKGPREEDYSAARCEFMASGRTLS